MRGKGWSRTGWPRGRERGCRVKEHPWGPRGVASRWVSTEACAGCRGLCSKKGSEMNGFDIFFSLFVSLFNLLWCPKQAGLPPWVLALKRCGGSTLACMPMLQGEYLRGCSALRQGICVEDELW